MLASRDTCEIADSALENRQVQASRAAPISAILAYSVFGNGGL